jgi:Peptidase family C25
MSVGTVGNGKSNHSRREGRRFHPRRKMIRKLRSLWVLLLFAAAGFASAQTVFVEDHFTDTNNTTLQSHSPDTGGAWTLRAGFNLDIQTNTLEVAATNSAGLYTNATAAPAADYEMGMSVTFGNPSPNNYINLLGRANSTGTSGYLAQVANGAVTVWPVTGGVKGAAIISATPTLSTGAPHYVVLEMIGNQISLYIDGTQYGPATDNTFSAGGFVGLGINAVNAGNAVADDFFAGTRADTEARMRTMTARRQDGRALIEWATGREVSNLGFRVWRQDGARRTAVTPGIVAGSAFLTGATLTAGNRYGWIDDEVSPRSRYWIESIGVNGRSEWSGPIAPVEVPFDAPATAPFLRDLTQHMAPSVVATRMHPALAPTATRRAVTPPGTLPKQQELAAEPAIKISIDADGWYRVARDELLAAGLDPGTDPHRLHLYVEGREIAMTVEGEAQGTVDAVRFYGSALDTPSTATHVYWLAAEDGPARRIQTVSATGGGASPSGFPVSAERRDKLIYFAALLNGDQESFFGPVITNDAMSPALQTLQLPHIDRSAPTAELEIGLQGGGDAGNNVLHDVAVALNGQPLDDIVFSGRDASYTHRVLPLDRFVDGDNTLTFAAKNGDGDVSLVSYVRITYARTYDFDSSPLFLTAGSGTSVSVAGATSPSMVALDITAPDAPVELPVSVSEGVAHFAIPPGLGRGVIVTAEYAHAARVAPNAPSSLHATPGADMIIIAHPSLLPALEPLQQIRTAQGLSVLVASIDDVYDEYNYGAKDPVAVRAFLSATRSWKTVPRYVLLVGDATFDPRNYLGAGDLDLLPTKLVMTTQMKTASDSWLTDFNDDGVADMAIGRLPAQTLAEAQIEVGKVVAYENAASGQPWMRSALLVTDTDASIDFAAMSGAVRQLVPAGYATATIDLGASDATAARQGLLADLDAGALFVNYIGHGSVGIWTDSGLFGNDDSSALTNGARLPVVVAMTCLNGYFHDPSNLSLAASLLVAPNGGAVAVWASSCVTDAHAQTAADQELARSLFSDHATIGEASLAAQRKATDPDVQRTFLLFGDPAMRLRQ